MPRLARLDAPGVLRHVTIRGIERRKIFNDNQDMDNFLDRLATLLIRDPIKLGWEPLIKVEHYHVSAKSILEAGQI